jgi:hypothetical protein
MTDATGNTVFGMFPSRREAEAAVHALERAGFARDSISVAMRHDESLHSVDADPAPETAEGAAAGAVSGGVVGGTVGLLAGLGVIAIPGLGPALAAGWLASTLLGAGVGAAAGGLIGGLVGMGVPEEDAKRFESTFQQGGVLVAVETGARSSEAAEILRSNRADVSPGTARRQAREFSADELNPHGDKLRYSGVERRRRTGVGSYVGPERRQILI